MRKIVPYIEVCVFAVIVGALMSIAFQPARASHYYARPAAGGFAQKWIGYPNTNGTPSAPVGNLVLYGTASADRIYGRPAWTATENGTLQAISCYWNQAWNNPAIVFVGVYIGDALVAGANVGAGNNGAAAWTSYIELTGTLNFSTNDVLRYGISYCEDSATIGLSRDDGASDGYIQFDSTTAQNCAVPGLPATASWQTSGTSQGLAIILRYVQR